MSERENSHDKESFNTEAKKNEMNTNFCVTQEDDSTVGIRLSEIILSLCFPFFLVPSPEKQNSKNLLFILRLKYWFRIC